VRFFSIVADVVMGLILGLFLYVAASHFWSPLRSPVAGTMIVGASVLMVLLRRPNGSLARRDETRPEK